MADIIDKAKEVAESMFNFPQIDSDLTVWFILDGKEYEVEQFSVSFGQGVDYKGQPQDETRGGQIMLLLSEAVPNNIYKWAMTSTPKDGMIEFRSKTTNPPLKVEFVNGYCVNFDRTIDEGTGLSTSMMISAEEVTINGINMENHWA